MVVAKNQANTSVRRIGAAARDHVITAPANARTGRHVVADHAELLHGVGAEREGGAPPCRSLFLLTRQPDLVVAKARALAPTCASLVRNPENGAGRAHDPRCSSAKHEYVGPLSGRSSMRRR